MKTMYLHCLLLGMLSMAGFCQELPDLTPLSPNAAAMTQYGEIPVSHFTGVPHIGIPLYTISTPELTLPLSLQYHAGGNKVEAIASWVGLGWSLGTLPSISRSVRGLPDDGAGGFFQNGFQGHTIKEIYQEGAVPDYYFRELLYDQEIDPEPDMFSYSLPGESGKFFYDQQTQSFVTLPKTNTRIVRDGNAFVLTTPDGTDYVMNMREETDSRLSTNLVTSTWYASQIIAASKKDTIRLHYTLENQRYVTKSLVTKYQRLTGDAPTPGNGGLEPINDIMMVYAQLPKRIDFKNGYILFVRSTAERGDLTNGYALDHMAVYDRHDTLIKRFNFSYSYFTGTGSGCNVVDDKGTQWLRLDTCTQVASDTSESLPHRFYYNTTNIPPCRTSAAQDYWGYYNGHTANDNLIPTFSFSYAGRPIQIEGANREVVPAKAQFGILEKIVYPTGGHTEFDFEGNETPPIDLPPSYTDAFAALESDYYGQEDWPVTHYYEDTFTIDNPPDDFLNANNPDGGAFVDVASGYPGCDLSQGANICAVFRIKGTSPSNDHINLTVSSDFTAYFPNGTYQLSAEFFQDPPQYQNFFFSCHWNKLLEVEPTNRLAGGLRIREIKSYTSPTATPLVTRYKYTLGVDSEVSSGDVFSEPNFSVDDVIEYVHYEYIGGIVTEWDITHGNFLRLRSKSNIPQVTDSGAYIGYTHVIEERTHPDQTGITTYSYSNTRDIVDPTFPYPPGTSYELERGQLLEEVHYKKSGDALVPVQKKTIEYSAAPYHQSAGQYATESYGLRWGNNKIANLDPFDILNVITVLTRAQQLAPYTLLGGWNEKSKETLTQYFEDRTLTTTTTYGYDNPAHLQVTQTTTTHSEGTTETVATTYPQDLGVTSSGEAALLRQHRIATPIKTESRTEAADGSLLAQHMLRTLYKEWEQDIVFPQAVQSRKTLETSDTDLYETRIEYQHYDGWGNLREVRKREGTPVTYIWGYQGQYPIAKIENATYAQVAAYEDSLQALADADDDRTRGTAGNEGALRTAGHALRAALPEAMVTTYTHDPLVGMTSSTDPRGETTYYQYDGLQRLTTLRDANGHLVATNQYHYKK